MSMRKQDTQSEIAVAGFLDKYFYPQHTSNFQRCNDLASQLKGIDVVFNYNGNRFLVDEKAATHYVNKDLPTFAFELDFVGRDHKLHEGWFYDASKVTEYYLLAWVWASKNKDFTTEDISKVDLVLVSRKKIQEMLVSNGLSKERAMRGSKYLRDRKLFGVFGKSSKPFYFYYTKQKAEKPINIIIRKKALQKISVLNLTLRT